MTPIVLSIEGLYERKVSAVTCIATREAIWATARDVDGRKLMAPYYAPKQPGDGLYYPERAH